MEKVVIDEYILTTSPNTEGLMRRVGEIRSKVGVLINGIVKRQAYAAL
jgi:uncharacterized protein YfkK (UPF0435 family)